MFTQPHGPRFDDIVEMTSAYARGRMARREFLRRAMVLGLSASAIGTLLAACGGDDSSGGASPTPQAMDTTLPDKIVFFNYSNYMSPTVLEAFTKEYGVKVVTPFYDTNETALAKLKGGATGYDIVVPSDYMVSIMKNTGLLQPLNMDYIPNFAGVEPFLQKPAYDPAEDGKKYSVPYMFGSTGITVRTDKYDGEISAWADLWDTANKGKIQMMDDVRQTMGAALMLLGYSINETDEAHIAEAGDKLVEQKPLVLRYNNAAMKRDILQPSAPIIHAFDGDTTGAARELPEGAVKYVLPKEGYNVWADNLCLLAASENPYGAHVFINFLLEPENAAACTDFIGYQTAVADAVPLIKDETVKAMRPTSEQLATGQFLEDVGEASRLYDEAWRRVKSA